MITHASLVKVKKELDIREFGVIVPPREMLHSEAGFPAATEGIIDIDNGSK